MKAQSVTKEQQPTETDSQGEIKTQFKGSRENVEESMFSKIFTGSTKGFVHR